MREFFRGWRRKVGVCTLVVACVFAVMWVRSLHSRQFIFIEFGNPIDGRINVYGCANQIDILLQRSTGWYFAFGEHSIEASNALSEFWFFDVQNIDEVIEDDVLQVAPGYKVRIYFYVIVLPLTLISLWLLLSKARKSIPQKVPVPTANEGA